ncbi:NUDIX domain-containing protein [Gemmatimonas sp.]|uniref:NUDIX domain-containing protein n=1 Tax=Gemmatimonas sp. TaxID=1962908 RepID=UPI00334154EE
MSFDDTQLSTTRVDVRVVDVVVLAPAPPGGADRWQVLAMRRAAGTRCTGAWEIVHGRIERGERPGQAARREVQEETGLTPERLYSITVNPFYLHRFDSVQLAVVFAAVVDGSVPITTGAEHDAWEWLSPADAMDRLAWPREHQALQYTLHLLRHGDAGPVEDVLLVP